MLTQARLKELLHYEPETGAFRWRAGIRIRHARADGTVGSAHNAGYLAVRLDHRAYLLHRLAWLYMTGEWPADQIDHANGDRADNRWANLRAANRSQNIANGKRRSNNTSGFKGVSWYRRYGAWKASICVNQRRVHLGYFDTPDAAHAAYLAKAHELFGEFARAA